jgi:hypothetical protein
MKIMVKKTLLIILISFGKTLGKKIIVYVEGTSYPSISLLEIERDIMPTSQGWEKNYAYSWGVRTLPLLRSRYKNAPIHSPCNLHRFGL